jgi:hypothetical protein
MRKDSGDKEETGVSPDRCTGCFPVGNVKHNTCPKKAQILSGAIARSLAVLLPD